MRPGKGERQVILDDGAIETVPSSWVLLPPGDAALTRRVKKAGPHYQVEEKRGRKRFSRGVWAPAEVIEAETMRRKLEKEDPSYQKKLQAGRNRRKRLEEAYGEAFYEMILSRLGLHEIHSELAEKLARAITKHATPVGSGTVARTKRISIEERADAAIIAWMRHHTTGYDNMTIARVKGERRRVRRKLAGESKALLDKYRKGDKPEPCLLSLGLEKVQNV